MNVTVAALGTEDGASVTQQGGGATTIANLVAGNADLHILTGTMRVIGGSGSAVPLVNFASGATLDIAGSIPGVLTSSGTVFRSNNVDTAFTATTGQFIGTDALAFNGTLGLRGASVSTAPGSLSAAGRYWLHSQAGSQLLGTKFHLDIGSATNNGAAVVVGDWDGTSGNRLLTLASLTGYGSLRSDAGGDGFRHIVADQATSTTFSGMILAHAGTGGQLRSVFFDKPGAGTLTMANVMGRQTASASGTTNAEYSVQVNGGKLVMLATNTILGPIAVAGGASLEINGAGLLGNGGSHAYVITNDGTFVLDSTANQSLSGAVTGTGTFVKTNTGTLFIHGTFTASRLDSSVADQHPRHRPLEQLDRHSRQFERDEHGRHGEPGGPDGVLPAAAAVSANLG